MPQYHGVSVADGISPNEGSTYIAMFALFCLTNIEVLSLVTLISLFTLISLNHHGFNGLLALYC